MKSPDNSLAGAHGALARLRHDLRTELDQILGYAEMLQEDAKKRLEEGWVRDLEHIQEAGHRVLALIDNLLEQPSAVEIDRGARSADEQSDQVLDKASLLVVDDHEMNRDMLSRRLGRKGYDVDTAADGPEALRKIEAGSFDLVLLDIMMPGMNGIEVLTRLRQRNSPTELPVIMVSAKGESADMVVALQAGASDYVTKPVDLPVALARVRTQLALKRASDAAVLLSGQVEMRNRMIRQIFGRYLTDEVVESLLERPEGLRLGGEKRRISILLADLRGFTPLSESLPPETIVALVNGYLGIMSEVIIEHGGTIDEFIGDAILVLFGAPIERSDHARASVTCAQAMQRAMEEVNRRNAEAGLPAVAMGIGINTGEVVVGNIGSERRAKYGVVGHNVNLAARIESYTSGGQILISESTLSEAGEGLRVVDELEVTPKGLRAPMTLYEVG